MAEPICKGVIDVSVEECDPNSGCYLAVMEDPDEIGYWADAHPCIVHARMAEAENN